MTESNEKIQFKSIQQPRKLIDTRQKDGQSDPDKRTYKVILQMYSFYYSTEKEYLEN